MKSVAVAILNYNGINLLKEYLKDVILNSPEADVILIDNNSSDGSAKWFKINYPKLKCIKLKRNYGYAEGYNKGLEHLKGLEYSYYALINNDLWVPKNWLPPLIDNFRNFKNVAIVQPHILDKKKPNMFEYSGAAGGFIDKYGLPFCRGRILNSLEKDNGQYDKAIEVFWASGACFLIRNQVFWQLGGFDRDFYLHQEEIDLCWRAQNNGYKIIADGKSKVYHLGGSTLKESPKKTYYNHRNSLFMLAKNLPKEKLFSILLYRILLDGVLGIIYFINFKFFYTWAIIKAHLSFYNMFKTMKQKNNINNCNVNYFLVKNILLKYFLYRVLYFSDLKQKFK